MEITIIHGQTHKGSTYHIGSAIKEKLADSGTAVHEYFLPKDGPGFCVGCCQCIQKDETKCPQAEKVQAILASMNSSEVIIIDSPAYCFEMTGQLKTLFDHFGYIWMPHRPRKEMFSKIGIVVSTAAGGGAANVTKSIKRQLFWWGVPKIFRMPVIVGAARWDEVSDAVRQKIDAKADAVSRKAKMRLGIVTPGIKIRFLFGIMRKMQRKNNWNPVDGEHWKNNGWLEEAKPWR